MIGLFSRSEDHTLLVSVIAAVEVRSALRRRQKAGDIDAANAALAISSLIHETGRIVEHPITAPTLAEASGIIDRHSLRALDSIQLASALVAKAALTRDDNLRFVASDQRLLEAAQREGLLVWNPEDSLTS
jgi:predicted nucleic acid-binding protein